MWTPKLRTKIKHTLVLLYYSIYYPSARRKSIRTRCVGQDQIQVADYGPTNAGSLQLQRGLVRCGGPFVGGDQQQEHDDHAAKDQHVATTSSREITFGVPRRRI